ncbi:alpha-2-macroglobulin family protein [Hufsiella ginkgonis]|uniref:Alpha-2-macroglobulin domain-containing protein n=1 Tax=Hufsiella ginkgonis TaxID=2695274 RepID=A0A7K1XS44_9SPHI|nr:alpha-2-macroglobulin family protein [Hufsiella ginkgonis]MXV13821.1 hypothetical protein [Hufsiella ginkgonis]
MFHFSRCRRFLTTILCSCALFPGNAGFAQDKPFEKLVKKIDSLATIGLAGSAFKQVDSLYIFAQEKKDPVMLVRAAIYKMIFLSYLEEDALPAVIDGLRTDIGRAAYPGKAVLQSLLAETYWRYYQQNRYKFSQRATMEKPGTDYTRWDLRTLVREISAIYKYSLSQEKLLKDIPVSTFAGALKGDKLTRKYRPTLYDLLLHRALDFFLSEDSYMPGANDGVLFDDPRSFGDSRSFASLIISRKDTSLLAYSGAVLLQQGTAFHLESDRPEALADLDLRRLEFVWRRSRISQKDSLYMQALRKMATGQGSFTVAADALVLMAKYEKQNRRFRNAVPYLLEAIARYPGSQGAGNAAIMLDEIRERKLNLQVENINLPGKPILALLGYRNPLPVSLKIYRVTVAMLRAYNKERSNSYGRSPGRKELNWIQALPPVQEKEITPPDPGDYSDHSVEIDIQPLEAGRYIVAVTGADTLLTVTGSFHVSEMAALNRALVSGQREVMVVNRQTGKPVNNVQVTVEYANDKSFTRTVKGTTTAGRFRFAAAEYAYGMGTLILVKGKDTLLQDNGYYGDGGYDRNADSPVIQTTLITDRQIYRPGQTIWFKGYQLSRQVNKSVLVKNEPVELKITGINGKELGTMPFVTNDFGSFSGSFMLPQVLQGGMVTLRTKSGQVGVMIEEYKRPTFQVKLDPVKEAYHINDSIKVTGRVVAFSGYGLSNARIAYRVTRTTSARDYPDYRYNALPPVEIRTDTILTDAGGTFTIRFRAAADDTLSRNVHTFLVSADVTDGSGETRPASVSIAVAKQVLRLSTNIRPTILPADSLKFIYQLRNLGNHRIAGKLDVKVFSLKSPGQPVNERFWNMPDQHLMSREYFERNFPLYDYSGDRAFPRWVKQQQVADFKLTADTTGYPLLDLALLRKRPAGMYRVEIAARTARGDTISTIAFLNVLEYGAAVLTRENWVVPAVVSGKAGQQAEIWAGNGEKNNVFVEVYDGRNLLSEEWLQAGEKQLRKTIAIRENSDRLRVNVLMMTDNRVYNWSGRITLVQPENPLRLTFSSFRDKLQPGDKEQWEMKITGQDEGETAEMVAGLYDASLDDLLSTMPWPANLSTYNRYYPDYNRWQAEDYNRVAFIRPIYSFYRSFPLSERNYETLNLFGYSYYGGYNSAYRWYLTRVRDVKLQGGFNSSDMLNEMTAGYGAQAKKSVVGSIAAMAPMMYDELKEVSLRQEVEALNAREAPLKEANVTEDNSIHEMTEPLVTIRKNFNETAFFYPNLRTDEKGMVTIGFTIPDALTRWKFRALAHTKDLQSGYLQKEAITQKQLMISANMPRFLREGDTVTVSARLANLTGETIKGQTELRLFNAINMQPVQLLRNPASAKQAFEIAARTTRPVSFTFIIPAGLDALTYNIRAISALHTDGEENTVPVLPNRVPVTESMPLMVRAGQQQTFTFDRFVKQASGTLINKTLTFEFTSNPVWYAVQALPYLSEVPYECSEQVFSRYYANTLARQIVNTLPQIKPVFERWKDNGASSLLSNLEKNQELKAVLVEETPWLRDAESESEQQRRIALLFDLNNMSNALAENLSKLSKMQRPDGGFPWFTGSLYADQYITQHILAGMGQLTVIDSVNAGTALKPVALKTLDFVDEKIIENYRYDKRGASKSLWQGSIVIHAWYARSYFARVAMKPALKEAFEGYINLTRAIWNKCSAYEQAMIALTLLRYQQPALPAMIVRSLKDTAKHTGEMGMYWPVNQLGYAWNQSPVEVQAVIMELFAEAGENAGDIEEMKIWLLRKKQTSNWKTTKATAAACYALLMRGSNLLAETAVPEIKLGGHPLTALKPSLVAETGTGYLKTAWTGEDIKPLLGNVAVKNTGKTISWGALHWQYLENPDKLPASLSAMKLERKYYILKYTANGPVLTAVDAQHIPKVGDELKVVINIVADRDYEYVHLKDLRPAGTEPSAVLSGYKYQDQLYYYQVTKDVSTNFFFNYLPRGNYVVEYRLRVSQPGNFSAGFASMQSVYAPEFNAHGEGSRVVFR